MVFEPLLDTINPKPTSSTDVPSGSITASNPAEKPPFTSGVISEARNPARPGNSAIRYHEPTNLELISTWLLQIFGVLLALLFGVFGILAYFSSLQANNEAHEANSDAQLANQLSFVSICMATNSNSSYFDLCASVLSDGEYFTSIAGVLFPQQSASASATTTPVVVTTGVGTTTGVGSAPTTSIGSGASPTASPEQGNTMLPPAAIAGITLGILGAVVMAAASLRLVQQIGSAKRRKNIYASS